MTPEELKRQAELKAIRKQLEANREQLKADVLVHLDRMQHLENEIEIAEKESRLTPHNPALVIVIGYLKQQYYKVAEHLARLGFS